MNLERYQALKAKAEELRREAGRREGALAQLQARLKTEFGCASAAEAKRLLAKLDRECKAAEAEAEKAMNSFEKKWGGKL